MEQLVLKREDGSKEYGLVYSIYLGSVRPQIHSQYWENKIKNSKMKDTMMTLS